MYTWVRRSTDPRTILQPGRHCPYTVQQPLCLTGASAWSKVMAPSPVQCAQPMAGSRLPVACQVVQPPSIRAPVANVSRVQVVDDPQQQGLPSRRALLLAAATAMALVRPPPSVQAQSSLCVDAETEELDTECRRAQLAGDAKKILKSTGNYEQSTSRKFEVAPNVPVAEINDVYAAATLKLGNEIEEYLGMDVYDKARIPLIKLLKADGTEWVSKYARGGSARTQSARRMYIAVDAVVGHLASNGYAPMPAPKAKSVLKSLGEAREYLAKGI